MYQIRKIDLEDSTMYIGNTADIKAMYKSIARNKHTELMHIFCDAPRFSESKRIYALDIDNNNNISIVNSDTALYMLLCEGVRL